MNPLRFKLSPFFLKNHNTRVILLCFLSGCFIVNELLPVDVNPYIGLTIGRYQRNSTLIYDTKVMYPSSSPCGSQAFQLLILIASRPDSLDIRNVIRKTWLRNISQHNPPVHYVFLVGRAPTRTLRRLQKEQEHHGDLVVLNFQDTYRNLTRKTLLGLDWAWQMCPQVEYVMKADDDTYVNVTNVLNLLALEVVSRPHMVGTVKARTSPVRVRRHKHYVSEAEYTPTWYPDYCDGGSYILPIKVAQDVVRVTMQGDIRPVLHIEDVHVGRCVRHLGYGIRHRNALNVDHRFTVRQPEFMCSSRMASVHRVTKEDMVDIWNRCTTSSNSSHRG